MRTRDVISFLKYRLNVPFSNNKFLQFVLSFNLGIFVLILNTWYMAKKQQKWYVVWKGFEPGIYESWESCKQQINGYAGAVYKSYTSKRLAHEIYKKWLRHEREIRMRHLLEDWCIKEKSICTDAACAWNPWQLEWRWVETMSWKEIFHSEIYEVGTVNIGEYIALLRGMKYLLDRELAERVIYTDSIVAMSRFRKGTPQTDLYKVESNKDLRHVLEQWHAWRIKTNPCIEVIKRNTKSRGEIPADFGRK